MEWVQVSGRGILYTYVIVHQAVLSQWREVAPYNVVQVSIEEAPNVIITGNAIDIDNSELKVGLPLEVVFDQVTPEDTLPRWRERRTEQPVACWGCPSLGSWGSSSPALGADPPSISLQLRLTDGNGGLGPTPPPSSGRAP